VSNLPDVLTGVPLEGAPPADLTGGTTETSTSTSTSTSTQAGPFLPRTGGHAGQAAQVGLLTLLLGALLSLCGHRPRHALRR
jgi:hypothetical protein